MPGPTREYQFVTGVETSIEPTATATPTDDNDLVTKGFITAAGVHIFKLTGAFNTPLDQIDGFHVSDGTKDLVRVRVFGRNATVTGSITIRYQVNEAGSQTDTFTLTAGSDFTENETLTTPESLVAGNKLSIDVTAISGRLDDLYIECYFG